MSFSREFDIFSAHNWGNLLPALGANAKDKYDGHERVREVKNRLESLGVSVWFDEDQLHGDDIKQDIIAAIDNTKVFAAFITKTYQDKVNSGDSNEICYFELNYATRKSPPRKMLAVIMEEEMKDKKNWTGRLIAELGNHLYVDMTKAFESFEQRQDDTLLETKCQEMVAKVRALIENRILPTVNPDTQAMEFFNLPYNYTWIKPFFENDISTDHDVKVERRLWEVGDILKDDPRMNDYFLTFDYSDFLKRIMSRRTDELSLKTTDVGSRAATLQIFLTTLLSASGDLVVKILTAIIALLADESEESLRSEGSFYFNLSMTEIISILGSLFEEKDEKIFSNKQNEFHFLLCIAMLLSSLLPFIKERIDCDSIRRITQGLINKGLFEGSTNDPDSLPILSVSLFQKLCQFIIAEADQPDNWGNLELLKLQFLLAQVDYHITTNSEVMKSICQVVTMLGKTEQNNQNLAELDITTTLLRIYQSHEKEVALTEYCLEAMIVTAENDTNAMTIRNSKEYLRIIISEGLENYAVASGTIKGELITRLQAKIVLTPVESSCDGEVAILSYAASLLFEHDFESLTATIDQLISRLLLQPDSAEKQSYFQLASDYQLYSIFEAIIRKYPPSNPVAISPTMKRSYWNFWSLTLHLLRILSNDSEEAFDYYSHEDRGFVCHARSLLSLDPSKKLVILSSSFFISLFQVIASVGCVVENEDIPDVIAIDNQWSGLREDQLRLLVEGIESYFDKPDLLLIASQALQLIISDPENARVLTSLDIEKSLWNCLDYYKKRSEHYSLMIELLQVFAGYRKTEKSRNAAVTAVLTNKQVSILIDILLHFYPLPSEDLNCNQETVMQQKLVLNTCVSEVLVIYSFQKDNWNPKQEDMNYLSLLMFLLSIDMFKAHKFSVSRFTVMMEKLLYFNKSVDLFSIVTIILYEVLQHRKEMAFPVLENIVLMKQFLSSLTAISGLDTTDEVILKALELVKLISFLPTCHPISCLCWHR